MQSQWGGGGCPHPVLTGRYLGYPSLRWGTPPYWPDEGYPLFTLWWYPSLQLARWGTPPLSWPDGGTPPSHPPPPPKLAR